jgi:hypothetical protein
MSQRRIDFYKNLLFVTLYAVTMMTVIGSAHTP